jgi:hypothetical protein
MVNRWEATMSMKTILVPMENHDAMQSALETALLLGRRCDSYIEGFRATVVDQRIYSRRRDGGRASGNVSGDIAEEAKKAKQIFETFMQKHDVPRQPKRQSRCHSAGWTMRQRGKASLAAMAAFST